MPYGEDYIEALHAIHDGWSEQRRRREADDERVQVAVWHCGEYSGAVTIAHLLLGKTAHHWASIDFRGVRITQDVFLGDAGKLDHLPKMLIQIMRWGDTDGADMAEHLVAELVDHDRTHLIRHLPELARWLRADGRSVEVIAAERKKKFG